MPYEYKLMPSPVGQLTLVARNGKLSAILWETERANRVRLHLGPTGRQITSIIALVAAGQGVALVPECTQSLMNKGVTYRPLVEGDAYAQLLVLTPAETKSVLVEAFLSVIVGISHNR